MKFRKTVTIAMAALLALLTVSACGSKENSEDGGAKAQVQTEESALKLLETVWESFDDDQRFPIMGGDAAAGIVDQPGSFSLEDAATADSMLGIPEALAAQASEAASMIHMMNANSFTGAVFKTADGEAAGELAAEIEMHLSQRQWICGFPEKLYIAVTDDGYVISAFGAEQLLDVFTEKLGAAYKVETVVDKSLE